MKFLLPIFLAVSLSLPLTAQETKPAAPAATDKATAPADRFAKWEKEIAGIEAADKKNPPAKGSIVFIGSSTVRMWKSLATDYPQHKVVNHGFGGSEIADSTHFADRLIFPIEPAHIFLRAGNNDIAAGKSPEKVFADYQDFVKTVHAKLPEAEIVFIGLPPTILRIKQVPACNTLNGYIREFAAKNPKLKYIDCDSMTVGSDGQPRPELFLADKLHLNAEGYKLLAERVRPFMPAVK